MRTCGYQRWLGYLAWALLVSMLTTVSAQRPAPRPAQHAPVSARQVNDAIQAGVNFLKRQQDPRSGTWTWDWDERMRTGVTALCTLALINSGVPQDDPVMMRAMQEIRRPDTSEKTYCIALKTMVLCAAEPDRDRALIRDYVATLQRTQITTMPNAGGWGYGDSDRAQGAGDPSNSQFAMLALYEAERVGIEVPDAVWRRGLGYWTRLQKEDGSWPYEPHRPSTGSMTCAGIASTIMALGQATEGDARVKDDRVECCQPQADDSIPVKGLAWLGPHLSVTHNPIEGVVGGDAESRAYYLYYMYALERVGRMTANRFLGQHDWYREGAESLLRLQDPVSGAWRGLGAESNQEVATALSLLFLSKGRRPVVACKLQTGTDIDWQRHRHDLANLTGDVERRWKRDLSWQVIRLDAANLEDLLQSPVLYLCGRDGLTITTPQKQLLKQYIEQGGFIFAVRCCEGEGFDRDFRALMAELFPDNELRLLPPDHPIWFAEQPIPTEFLPQLYGLDACCRTSVVYCPDELSGYWELATARQLPTFSGPVKAAVQAKLAVGANVLTYATNRELKEKLDAPQRVATPAVADNVQRATLHVAKLQHGGGSDDAPAALRNLLEVAGHHLDLRVDSQKRQVSPTSEQLFDYPIVFAHGRRSFHFSATDREALATYLKRGGFLFADAICASPDFAQSFRAEMKAILPDAPLRPIPPDDPLWTDRFQGYDLRRVQLRNPRAPGADASLPLAARLEQVAPQMEGIEIDGRWVVVFSAFDLSCALENQASIECKGYVREDAAKLGVNILLYAMLQ